MQKDDDDDARPPRSEQMLVNDPTRSSPQSRCVVDAAHRKTLGTGTSHGAWYVWLIAASCRRRRGGAFAAGGVLRIECTVRGGLNKYSKIRMSSRYWACFLLI